MQTLLQKMPQLKLYRTTIILISISLFTFSCGNKEGGAIGGNSEKDTTIVEDTTKVDNTSVDTDTPVQKKIDTIRGIDVSHFQGSVDWGEVKSSGMHFGIAKATQGMTYIDPKFHENWKNIEESGLFRGTYHFYVANDDPTKQAEHFVNTVKSMGTHHLPPALDLEGEGIGDLTVEQYQNNVLIWLKYVEENLGHQPMIYTNNPFGNQYLDSDKFVGYQLWIAEYGSKEAKIPTAWNDLGWTGWQFTSHDKLNGVVGVVDESRFLSSILMVD